MKLFFILKHYLHPLFKLFLFHLKNFDFRVINENELKK